MAKSRSASKKKHTAGHHEGTNKEGVTGGKGGRREDGETKRKVVGRKESLEVMGRGKAKKRQLTGTMGCKGGA